MIPEAVIPFLWYGAGSLCFLAGTAISITSILGGK